MWCQKLHGFSHFCIKRMPHRFELHSYHQHKWGLGKSPTTNMETVGRCIKACNTESSNHKHISAILPFLLSSANNMNSSTTYISYMHQSDAPPSFICGFTISPFIQSDFTISPFHHFFVTPFHHFAISPFFRHTILSFYGFTLLFLHQGSGVLIRNHHIILHID